MISWRTISYFGAVTALFTALSWPDIQKNLAATDLPQCTAGQTFTVDAPILLTDHDRLDMTGCTVRAAAGYGGNLLRASGAGITVVGGTWDRGSVLGNGSDRHALLFRHVTDLAIANLRIVSTSGKYAIAIGNATQVRVRDIDFATASDGVHITGPATDIDVRGLTGTTGDDMFAITGKDYPAYDDTRGPVNNVTADGIYASNSLAAVKIVGGTGAPVSDVTVRNVYGTTRIRPIAVIDDMTGPTVADGVVIDGVHAQSTDPAQHLVWLRGVASTDVTLRDVTVRRPTTAAQIILADRTTDIDVLTLDRWLLGPAVTGTAPLLGVYGQAQVGSVEISNLHALGAWSGPPVKVASTARVTTVRRY